MITALLIIVFGHSTSGQQYPNCNTCLRSDVVRISQPPLSYTTMRSDEFFGVTQPTNDGCTPVNGQGTINCGVGTTLMDCVRGPRRNLDFSDLSPYFVWNRTSLSEVRNVSTVFRFGQPVNISRISMWFWYAPRSASIDIPNLVLYSSNDDSTIPSNLITIDTSNSLALVENERHRLNVDIINGSVMMQSLRVMMSTTYEGLYVFLSEVLFCVSAITPTTSVIITAATTTTTTTTAASTAVTTTTTTTSILDTHSTTTGIVVSTSATSSSIPVSSSISTSPNIGLIVGVILAVISVTIVIIIIVIILLVVWKKKRSGSTKPEGVYYSTIGEETLQTSLPKKPEPIYTEMSDEKNNAKNISITNPTQKSVILQDNSNPQELVVLRDNPAYSGVANEQIKLQDNPAYGSASK